MTVLSGLFCLFLWLLSTSLPVLVLFAGLYGFTTSSVTSLPASIIGQITPEGSLGARIGAFFSVIALASLVGSPIGGALITDPDTKEGYRWLILFSVSVTEVSVNGFLANQLQGTSLLVGSMFMLGSRLLHTSDLRMKW